VFLIADPAEEEGPDHEEDEDEVPDEEGADEGSE
jgi:hypothetical protein